MSEITDNADMSASVFSHPNPGSTPLNTTWLGAGHAFFIFLSFFVSQILIATVIQFGVAFRVGTLGVNLQDPRVMELIQKLSGHWAILVGSLGAGLIMVKLTAWASRKANESPWPETIGWSDAKGSDLAIGLMSGLVLGAGFLIIAGHWFPPDGALPDSPISKLTTASPLTKIVWGFVIIGIVPLLEEFLFRGVMFSGISRSWGRLTATIMVTTIFVLVHLPQTIHYKPASVAIALLSLSAIWLRIRTNSIKPAFALHAGYNAALVAVTLFASSLA